MDASRQKLGEFITTGLREFSQTEFGQVRYGDEALALWLGVALFALLLFKIARSALSRRKHSRQHSGHFVAQEYRRGWLPRMLNAAPKLALAVVPICLLVAIADPFLTNTEASAESIDSRVRVDLVDTSASMSWEFPGTGKSKAEIARDAHLEFLEMRTGKTDRVSLWLFSNYPYMVDDFVMDDELYYFQVYDAPYVTSQRYDKTMMVPRDRVKIIPAEGDTNLVRPLEAIIRQFDHDAATNTSGSPDAGPQNRALLIITDAAIDYYPEAQFRRLHERNVVPYIIFINTSSRRIAGGTHFATPALVERIRDLGGDYFDVSDPDSLTRAYQAIDEREAVRVEVEYRALKVPIYSRFLLVGSLFGLFLIPLGLASELLWGTDP